MIRIQAFAMSRRFHTEARSTECPKVVIWASKILGRTKKRFSSSETVATENVVFRSYLRAIICLDVGESQIYFFEVNQVVSDVLELLACYY